ncbi:MAG: hypothetical protein IKE75_04665 [Bacilli bacterium]|nr:hypothetical protein [Bacilli bacterium]
MLYFLVSLVTFFTYLIFKGRRYLMDLQDNNFKLEKKKFFCLDKFLTLELIGIFLVILSFFLTSKEIGILFIVFYMIFSLFEIRNVKGTLKIKKEVLRTIIIVSFMYIFIFILIFIDYFNYQKGFIFYDRVNYYYPIVFVMGYFEFLIIYFSAILSKKTVRKGKTR